MQDLQNIPCRQNITQTIPHNATLLYPTIQYNTIQCFTTQYNTIPYPTLPYPTLLYSTILYCTIQHYTYNTLQYPTTQHNPTRTSASNRTLSNCSKTAGEGECMVHSRVRPDCASVRSPCMTVEARKLSKPGTDVCVCVCGGSR
jgi:hypothetical protein